MNKNCIAQWMLSIAFFMLMLNNVKAQTESSSLYPHRIRLTQPVVLTKEEQSYIESLSPLVVGAIRKAPPLVFYNSINNEYEGISVDVFDFIANAIGLKYSFINEEDASLPSLFRRFEQGEIDVLMPSSLLAERAKIGDFTDSYYESYYSIIMRSQNKLPFVSYSDLAKYKIGVLEKSSVIPYLESFVPTEQLHIYPSNGFYEALRNGEIDVAVSSTGVFLQDRYRLELYDLEDVQRLYEYPRHYAFLFQSTPELVPLVAIFNRYLAHIDNKASIFVHENREYQLIEKYLHEKYYKKVLIILLSMMSVLLIGLMVAYKQRRHLLQKLENLTRVDALTGLANRRSFDERLQLQYQFYKRYQRPLSVIMVDIDYFKEINDTYGHVIGDQYLKKIGSALMATVHRSTDLVARYGGEEFLCVLPNTSLEQAQSIAERIRIAIIDLSLSSGNTSYEIVTVSVGVATLDKSKGGVNELLETVDTQLYKAKNSGRNQSFSQLVF